MDDCLFCKIIAKQIPSTTIYEDEDVIAFNDIYPKAEVHFLVVPKKHIKSMLELTKEDSELIAKLMLKTREIAIKNMLSGGYKTHINTGINGGQEVNHLHIHIYGNRS